MQIEYNGIKTPSWREATSWLFTSMAEKTNSRWPRTNPSSRQSGTRTWDRQIASPTRWTLGHDASQYVHTAGDEFSTGLTFVR